MGHRFGPDLICTECGTTWEWHQVQAIACEPRGKVDIVEPPTPLRPPTDDEVPD